MWALGTAYIFRKLNEFLYYSGGVNGCTFVGGRRGTIITTRYVIFFHGNLSRFFPRWHFSTLIHVFSTPIFFHIFSPNFSTWIFHILSTLWFFTFFSHFVSSFFPHFFYEFFFTFFSRYFPHFSLVIFLHIFLTLCFPQLFHTVPMCYYFPHFSHAILFHTIFFTIFPQFSHVIVFHMFFTLFLTV